MSSSGGDDDDQQAGRQANRAASCGGCNLQVRLRTAAAATSLQPVKLDVAVAPPKGSERLAVRALPVRLHSLALAASLITTNRSEAKPSNRLSLSRKRASARSTRRLESSSPSRLARIMSHREQRERRGERAPRTSESRLQSASERASVSASASARRRQVRGGCAG